ncbi:BCL2 associated agonist of cell death [Homo sapiens]|uniref:BCL2 associated agonist of cell death n=1 Tax=Homo sapiens TaxID=9606 RepID=F5GYS3_HUMAN|nr:BCL2 associated agonist of cell death [Homo sapiens]KAI4072010.1 BCL2 associated agonist of cell death [Homo sapiens]
MFQIPEFEPSEQEDSSSAERGLGPSPAGDGPSGSGKHHRQAPGLLWDASHQQEQPTSSSHHGEGTSSPEERGHSNADAAKLQLDASLPVLVGSELGQGKLRPLPVTFAPHPETPPVPTALGSHLEYGRKYFPQAYAKRGSVLSPLEGGLTQIPFRCV